MEVLVAPSRQIAAATPMGKYPTALTSHSWDGAAVIGAEEEAMRAASRAVGESGGQRPVVGSSPTLGANVKITGSHMRTVTEDEGQALQ